jgi:hypothetical protein
MKVISRKLLPTKLPILSTAVTLHLLDYYNAAEWLWGVMVCFLIIGWVISICMLVNEEHVDIIDPKK